MFLAQNFPLHLIIGVGVFLAPTSTAWAQDTPSEDPSVASDTPNPQLKESVGATEQDAPEESPWAFEFGGYMRTQFSAVQNDPNYQLIGHRDGFSFASVYLDLEGRLDNGLGFVAALEGAAALPKSANDDANVELGARVQDAFLFYEPHQLARLSAGQFKAPFDAETLTSSSRLLFVQRSVGTRGVSGLNGTPVIGLSQGRQLGLRLDSDPYYFLDDSRNSSPSGPGVSYALALTNGPHANLNVNDNEKLAYYGRVNLHWGDLVRLGGGGFYNERTLGVAPDRLGETNAGWTGDLTVSAYGLSLLANLAQVDVTPAPELQAEQSRTARSMQLQIAYEEPFIGLQPTYRFANYDPNIGDDAPENSAYESLAYHTIGLNYNSPDYPFRLLLNYTLTNEEKRPIDNDRFDALVQLSW